MSVTIAKAKVWIWAICMAVVAACALPQPACAQARKTDSVTMTGSSAQLGKIVAGNTMGIFEVNPTTGAISKKSGGGQRLTQTSTVTTPTVTISCDLSLASSAVCNNGTVMTVTITSTAMTRVKLSTFTIGSTTGTSVVWGTPVSTANSTSFTVTFHDKKQTVASFRMGYQLDVGTTGSTGNMTLPYTVSISRP